jgi:hypothetical protein
MTRFCLDCWFEGETCETCELDAIVRAIEAKTGNQPPIRAYQALLRQIQQARRRRAGAVEGDRVLSRLHRGGCGGSDPDGSTDASQGSPPVVALVSVGREI